MIRPTSITDFLTDGSLAALCEAISALSGVDVELHDPDGRVIVSAVGETRWALRADAEGGAHVAAAAIDAPPLAAFPLTLATGPIGSLVVPARADASPDDVRRVGTLVGLVASIVSDLCDRERLLRLRVEELEVLSRLSTLLAAADDPDALLRVAIRAAVETLDADAGTIRLYDRSGRLLQLRTTWGLSPEYLRTAVDVPAETIPDRAALDGEIVCEERLLEDREAPNHAARVREGLVGMISAGLIFQGRPLGVIRVFTRTARRFSLEEQSLLRSIGQQAATALANARLLETEKEHRLVRAQVRLAADVQRRLLPRTTPRLPGVEIAARAMPSFELGGDFYDFIDLGGALGVTIGDVVGKGVAAALLMASVRSALRAYAQDIRGVAEVARRANQALTRDTLESEFATVFYGVLDPRTLRLTYCNAGHDPPIVLRRNRSHTPTLADLEELDLGGMVLGIDADQSYTESTLDLRGGDIVLLYTDGLADARSFDGVKYGKDRVRAALLDAVSTSPHATADQIADHLLWENRRFVGMNRRADDTTLVVLRVTGSGVSTDAE